MRREALGTKGGARAPSTEIAELLELDPELGTPVLQRKFVFYANDQPQQMSWSYYPHDLVRDTPVADPANEPWPGGNLAQLATLGIFVTGVEESVRARMPTPDERRTLNIAEGIPVLKVVRRMLTGPDNDRQPVEAANIIILTDNIALDYTIYLEWIRDRDHSVKLTDSAYPTHLASGTHRQAN